MVFTPVPRSNVEDAAITTTNSNHSKAPEVAKEPERRRAYWAPRGPEAYWTFEEVLAELTRNGWDTDMDGNVLGFQKYAETIWATSKTKEQDEVELRKRAAPKIRALTQVTDPEFKALFQGEFRDLPGIVLERFPDKAFSRGAGNPDGKAEEPTNLSLRVRKNGDVDFTGGVGQWAQVTMVGVPCTDPAGAASANEGSAGAKVEKKQQDSAGDDADTTGQPPSSQRSSRPNPLVRLRTSRSWTQFLRVNEQGVLEGKEGTAEEEGTIFELLWREPYPRFSLAPLGSSQTIGTFVARWGWEENASELKAWKIVEEDPEFKGTKCFGQDPRFYTFPEFVSYVVWRRWGGPAQLGALHTAVALWKESRTPEDCEQDMVIATEWTKTD